MYILLLQNLMSLDKFVTRAILYSRILDYFLL